MPSYSAFSAVTLVLKTLFIISPDSSAWNTFLIWLLRLITISFLFRTFLGPTILRLITKRLRVRSVSLRSIRGIYFHAGKAIIRIDRVGLSYHQRSTQTASRFSIKVEGLKVEMLRKQICKPVSPPTSMDPNKRSLSSKFRPSPIVQGLLSFLQSIYWAIYTFLDPYVRPLVRSYIVSALRVAIRALPAVTQILDLELVDATVVADNIDGAQLALRGASLNTSVELSQIHAPPEPQESKEAIKPGHKRFNSVVQWNARLKSSMRRSWDRAWGALEAHTSVTLKVEEISGTASQSLLERLKINSSGGNKLDFLKVPQFTFSLSACLDPRHGIQQHSLEVGLNLESIAIDLFVISRMVELLKTPPPVNPMVAASLAALGRKSTTPGSTPRVGWASSMSVLTASMRFRRGLKKPPVRKLDTRAIASKLSILKGVQVNVTRITLRHRVELGPNDNLATLNMTLRRVNIYAALSNPDSNPLHREWLGRNSNRGSDPLSAHVYECGFTIRETALDRIGSGAVSDHLRLLELGPLTAEAVSSQWPAPWLRGPSFFSGDPNAQVLLVQISLDKVQITERLEVLQALISHRKPKKPTPHSTEPLFAEMLSPMPRIQVGVHVGVVSGRLIYPTPEVDGKPFALELRTDGLQFTAQSHFSMLCDNHASLPQMDSDYPRLKMNFGCHLALQRTFVTVSMGVYAEFDEHVGHTGQPVEDEPILSLDVLQIVGNGEALGYMQEVPGTIVSLHTPSIYMQTHIFADALSVELWQPDAIAALSTITGALQANRTTSTKPPSRPLLDRIPPGIDLSFSIARLMVYVTGKDLAPDDDMGISRGIAANTGVSLHCCSLRPHHTQRMTILPERKEKRLKLSLPVELTSIAHARAASPTSDVVTLFVQAKLFDIAVRNSIATPLAADEPYDFEESSKPDPSKEFFTIREIVAQAAISGARVGKAPPLDTLDECQVSVKVTRVKGTLHLAQIYNVLLAANTIKKITGEPKRPTTPSPSPRPKTMNVTLSYTIDPVHLLWDFPMKSRLYIRLRSITGQLSPTGRIGISWESAVFATMVDWEKDNETHVRWEEILRLLNFDIEVRPSLKPVGMTVTGDSGRIRIPFGFVIADLILDINISIKCVKHLVHMVPSGQFSNPSTPEAEDAKNMPDLAVRVKCLSVEAADEDQETRLALIWRAGSEASRLRQERDEAFQAKVATIIASETNQRMSRELDSDFQFSPAHSVPIEEARERLNVFHAVSWRSRFRQAHVQQRRRESDHSRKNGGNVLLYEDDQEDPVSIHNPPQVPPLFRITLEHLSLRLSRPSFPPESLPDFLFKEGDGLPRNTEFSLLVPMHLNFSASSLRVAYREYPLPLVNIPAHSDEDQYGLEFDSDVVIAEEMGTSQSVYWVDCVVLSRDFGIHGAAPMTIPVPKTIMPVKSYAKPTIHVTTDNVSDLTWGVSYGPATQDFMRILDTLSHAPRDSSPSIGFWDKLRLVFHWRFRVYFDHDVHFHMKGSRDPHDLRGTGAGFALCWKGQPKLLIGQPNEQNELVQVVSDTMLVIVPNVEEAFGPTTTTGTQTQPSSTDLPHYRFPGKSPNYRKVCAKFTSGVRFGIGIGLERSCGDECEICTGRPFQRKCRFFEFRPHYEVMLGQKRDKPTEKSTNDSYNGFRSDFIHLSVSLTSAVNTRKSDSFSSIHLSPKLFAHFWAWWTLFDFKAPPIRQGNRYKQKRPLSPKFGQHLATLKYRIAVPKLFISHAYMDESSDAWADGVTPFVGVKAMIEMFQVDMHQRAQESTITKPNGGTKTVVHKPFYAVEVVMKDLDLRTLLAIYSEPLKQEVPLESSPLGSSYRTRENLPTVEPDSVWLDLDDFMEIDWASTGVPVLHLLPVVSCPRFTYFKRSHDRHVSGDRIDVTKFGNEDTHICLLNTEASVPQVQLQLAEKRIVELQNTIMANGKDSRSAASAQRSADARKMLPLLEDYVKQLHKDDAHARRQNTIGRQSYYMPSDSVSPEEWSEFSNVYQVHCPQVFMDNIIRDILLQYYYCSRARRGMEYHMASRAVKFIRDQAQMILESSTTKEGKGRDSASDGVRAAADAVRRMFGVDGARMTVEPTSQPNDLQHVDPMNGWSEGVSLRKSHFCLLLKPQFVLRSETDEEAVCVMTAVQGKLQTYNILDTDHADDPISGNILTRNFASITGLQTFSPSATNKGQEGCVPLEVMVDLRCDNSLFDRLVPQTDAIFQYDKFNRLRLQMQGKGVSAARTSSDHSDPMHDHLHNQTDLVRFHVPRFTISANDRHFQALSTIITNLLLFSDTASKIRTDRLDKMIFSYDFTDLSSAADVVASLQARLRHAVEMRKEAEWKLQGYGDDGQIEKLRIDAHVLMLTEELDLVFDAIRLAQEKAEDRATQKSALLLHASSAEISYRMLDRDDQLLAKLAVRKIDFHWLNRQDSSTVNNLSVGDLQAFDGSADAEWTEILSKCEDKSNHPSVKDLVQRDLFLLADWTVLPPVGGITIYEAFEVTLHPIRLQIDTRVGRRIMEYVWPARRDRNKANAAAKASGESKEKEEIQAPRTPVTPVSPVSPRRNSADAAPSSPRLSFDHTRLAPPPMRRVHTSRSFTDLRKMRNASGADSLQVPSPLQRTKSSDMLFGASSSSSGQASKASDEPKDKRALSRRSTDDASEMKYRSSQKTFIWVKVASLHLLLSIMKENSFLCNDARIRTRDLEYRNQTWSFEELVDQFIPSGRNWKGWVKMAFQQPLVPVLPVARELISKTKWGGTKSHHNSPGHSKLKRKETAKLLEFLTPHSRDKNGAPPDEQDHRIEAPEQVFGIPFAPEPEPMTAVPTDRSKKGRARVLSLFKRQQSHPHKVRASVDSDVSVTSTSSVSTNLSSRSVPSLPLTLQQQMESETPSFGRVSKDL